MVSFRLTEEEYDRFRRLCMSRGMRNVSELVRAAVTQMMNESLSAARDAAQDQTAGSDVNSRLATLESHLAQLATHFCRIESKLSGGPKSLPSSPLLNQSQANRKGAESSTGFRLKPGLQSARMSPLCCLFNGSCENYQSTSLQQILLYTIKHMASLGTKLIHSPAPSGSPSTTDLSHYLKRDLAGD